MRPRNPVLFRSYLNKHSPHRQLPLFSVMAVLILAILACTQQEANKIANPNAREAGPFTEEDCNIPGLPAPSTVEVHPTFIDCTFESGAGMQGLVYFHLYYYPKKEDAKKSFDDWHSNIADNYQDYQVFEDAHDMDIIKIVVTQSEDLNKPDVGFAMVEIRLDHFVILVKGGLQNTTQDTTLGLLRDLVTYGMNIGTDHYPQP